MKIRTLHPKVNLSGEPNYANLSLKTIKLYASCGIIAVVMGIILTIKIDNFFDH